MNWNLLPKQKFQDNRINLHVKVKRLIKSEARRKNLSFLVKKLKNVTYYRIRTMFEYEIDLNRNERFVK